MTRTLDLHFDELVIGADLSALIFAYNKKIPFIFLRHLKPYYYAEEDGFENQINLWKHLLFIMSIGGYCPFTNMIQSIRLEEDSTLKIVTKTNFLSTIKYNKLYISDDYKLEGLPNKISKTDNDNLVMDFMAISQRNTHYSEVSSIINNDRMLSEIRLTKKYVLDRKHTLVICKSTISDEELQQDEFSHSFIRMRFLRYFYPKIKEVKHIKREIWPKGKFLYEFPDNINILAKRPEELFGLDVKYDKNISLLESKLYAADHKIRDESPTSSGCYSRRISPFKI